MRKKKGKVEMLNRTRPQIVRSVSEVPMNGLISMEELSKHLKMSRSSIKRAKTNLGLPFFKLGDSVRFRLSDVESWLQEHRIAG